MKALIQRVSEASVNVSGAITGEIQQGLLIFVCAVHGDTEKEVDFLASKISRLRIFSDQNGKTNLSIKDVQGAVLVVSQFTLAANWKKGNRPSFTGAALPDRAESLYNDFCRALSSYDIPVETGKFGASMQVSLINDGPFTVWMDTAD